MVDQDNRWLPPSPHKEAVLEQIRRGRCYVQERGHNTPPLLVFQDGGVLELPRARARGNKADFWQAPGVEPSTRQTRYSDICGSIDELKQLLADEPELAEVDPDRLLALLDDSDYMLGRLAKRRETYRQFVAALVAALDRANDIAFPDHAAAALEAKELRHAVAQGTDAVRTRRDELHARAERFRDVANAAERVVRAYKELAIEIGKHYRAIKGARAWDDDPEQPCEG